MENERYYPKFEELMLQLAEIRAKYTNLMDNFKYQKYINKK